VRHLMHCSTDISVTELCDPATKFQEAAAAAAARSEAEAAAMQRLSAAQPELKTGKATKVHSHCKLYKVRPRELLRAVCVCVCVCASHPPLAYELTNARATGVGGRRRSSPTCVSCRYVEAEAIRASSRAAFSRPSRARDAWRHRGAPMAWRWRESETAAEPTDDGC